MRDLLRYVPSDPMALVEIYTLNVFRLGFESLGWRDGLTGSPSRLLGSIPSVDNAKRPADERERQLHTGVQYALESRSDTATRRCNNKCVRSDGPDTETRGVTRRLWYFVRIFYILIIFRNVAQDKSAETAMIPIASIFGARSRKTLGAVHASARHCPIFFFFLYVWKIALIWVNISYAIRVLVVRVIYCKLLRLKSVKSYQ